MELIEAYRLWNRGRERKALEFQGSGRFEIFALLYIGKLEFSEFTRKIGLF